MACAACKGGPTDRPIKMSPVDTGPGSLEATRRALEGSWTLLSLELVDARGAKTAVKATGSLKYDAFGNMSIHGVVDDPAMQGKVVLDYDGRIIIDTAKKQYLPAGLTSSQPVDPAQIAPVSPDKIRRYELNGDSLVVTYLGETGHPTAVAHWQRAGAITAP